MSNKAYRINFVEIEKNPTFNFSCLNETVLDEFSKDQLTSEGTGIVEISVERLKEILADSAFAPLIKDDEREAFLSDIIWAEGKGKYDLNWLSV